MRIIIPSPIPEKSEDVTSGIGRYLHELSRGLARNSDIELVSINTATASYDDKSGTGTVKTQRQMARRRLPATLALILGSLREIRELTRLYRSVGNKKHDVFHAQRVGCEYQTIAARLAGFKHVITTVHNLPGEDKAARHWFRRLIERLSFRCASHHICVSQATFDVWHERIGLKREKCTVIYNGMTPPDYSNFDRDTYRAKLGLTPDTVAIGICARLHYMKGHEILLKAFQQVLLASLSAARRTGQAGSTVLPGTAGIPACSVADGTGWKHCPTRLLIAGSGPEEEKLKRLTTELGLTEHVTFLGHRTDAVQFARALDINVLPSVTLETLGYSLIEAMFAGVPSVVSDVGGMKELVNASGGGKVVPAGDVQALAIALSGYILNSDLRTSHGQSAARYANAHLTSQQMAEATAAVYS